MKKSTNLKLKRDNGKAYEIAFNNLLFNGYTDHDYISANIFFKQGSGKNSSGIYNRIPTKFRTYPEPPIKQFLPAFK